MVLRGCTASPGRDTSTGCSGWSRHCDHTAAVPAVRRVLRAFGSVPRQNEHSSGMQILARTVHNVQQTVEISQVQFWGWFWSRPLLGNNGCLGWDRAMLRSMWIHVMHHLGWLLEEFHDFLLEGIDSGHEVDSRRFSAHMADEEVAVLVVNSGQWHAFY